MIRLPSNSKSGILLVKVNLLKLPEANLLIMSIERYRSLAPMYYRGAAAAIVVFDITKKDSLTGAKSWVKELQRRGDPNVVIALAGNKADLESKRKVQTEEAQQYASDNDIIFMETSAKTALNVRNLFVEIGESKCLIIF